MNLQESLYSQVFASDVVPVLFPNNEALVHSVDLSGFVSDATGAPILHVPQGFFVPGTKRNRDNFPAATVEGKDKDILMVLEDYSTDPFLIRNPQQTFLNYDARMQFFERGIMGGKTLMTKDMLYAWVGVRSLDGQNDALPAANIFQTTGSATTDGKKALTYADLLKAKKILDKADIPQDGRKILITPEMESELANDSDIKDAGAFGVRTMDNGRVIRVAGFDVMVRSSTVLYKLANATSQTLQSRDTTEVETNSATGYSQAAIAWHPMAVGRAKTDPRLFEDLDNPTYYGDIHSALWYGRGIRLKNDGVVSIVRADDGV